MAFVMVTKSDLAKLCGHHLDVLHYLFGRRWGLEGIVEERREATWDSLATNREAHEVRISTLL